MFITSNNLTILLCIICLIIILLTMNKKFKLYSHEHFKNNDDNNYIELFNNLELYNNEEGFQNGNQPLSDDNTIHYLYWTGGYDSTFRLCEMLIDERKRVQPIYVALVLDNDCQSEETCNKLWLRRNRKEEKRAMDNIIIKIKEDFPFVADNILPTLVIDENINDDVFNYNYENLFYSQNLWPKKRKKHQYLFLAKFAYYHKKFIDIGVLGIHRKSVFGKYLRNNLIERDNNLYIKDINHPLGYLVFPLYGRTKEDLLKTSKKYKFNHILKITWSCWFPIKGKPCKKCPMCRERII